MDVEKTRNVKTAIEKLEKKIKEIDVHNTGFSIFFFLNFFFFFI